MTGAHNSTMGTVMAGMGNSFRCTIVTAMVVLPATDRVATMWIPTYGYGCFK